MRMLALLLVGCIHQPWSKSDTVIETTSAALEVADWFQSGAIAADCRETNSVLGACGDRVPLGVFFPVMILAHAFVSYYLPSPWRGAFQGVTIGFQAHVSLDNWRAGYR